MHESLTKLGLDTVSTAQGGLIVILVAFLRCLYRKMCGHNLKSCMAVALSSCSYFLFSHESFHANLSFQDFNTESWK